MGMQFVGVGWTLAGQADPEFRRAFGQASRRVGWEMVIREKSSAATSGQLHHNDFAYQRGTGKVTSLDGLGSTEYREGLISRHEATGNVALVVVIYVEDRNGVKGCYFTTTIGFEFEALLVAGSPLAEDALVNCSL